jgi:hypothetical protein
MIPYFRAAVTITADWTLISIQKIDRQSETAWFQT